MSRRQFIKRATVAGAAITLLSGNLPAQAEKAPAPASSGESGAGTLPDYAGQILHSDMDVQSARKTDAKPDPKRLATGVGPR